ncbi:acyl-carrier protein [Rossellomorea marisflavi]|jgi:acyl carrier protein|uniref:Acyl-carrier protein n=1 Tax=Rossellomorea marisflavi TaxID=189381 RepID=A0A0M0G4Z8_9BACI|nr:acyl carrier protein [Rossellomorea marisflavi]MBV6682545.1 acyl carrier protein [Bacillus sp. JRC01]VXC57419.1 Acyl-carrier protein [Bacillus sp. 349Y]KON84873.1 acyl-carrier protein [Rossellomorea marisflavi]MCM2588040.1 acyl carrier protein [Rossellomorea marisflavi]MCM2603404.1 acyl carrier protein [Rossellomorea marisflavi]
MKQAIKEEFVQSYNLSVTPEEIQDDVHLFGEKSPYGLDSMDVLLFINLMKKKFDLQLEAINTTSFQTVNNIVEFIEKQKQEESSR